MSGRLRRFERADDLVSAVVDEVLTSDLSHGVALTGGRIGTQVSLAMVDALAAARGDSVSGGAAATGPVRLWFSDERFLPLGDADRNDTPVLARVGSDAATADVLDVMSVLGPDGAATASGAAADYQARLASLGLPAVAVLSIGPDGHVASVFPGHALMSDEGCAVRAVHDSPKPPPVRVTWTLPLIASVSQVLLLAAGEDKREAVERVLAGDVSLPATRLLSAGATLFVA